MNEQKEQCYSDNLRVSQTLRHQGRHKDLLTLLLEEQQQLNPQAPLNQIWNNIKEFCPHKTIQDAKKTLDRIQCTHKKKRQMKNPSFLSPQSPKTTSALVGKVKPKPNRQFNGFYHKIDSDCLVEPLCTREQDEPEFNLEQYKQIKESRLRYTHILTTEARSVEESRLSEWVRLTQKKVYHSAPMRDERKFLNGVKMTNSKGKPIDLLESKNHKGRKPEALDKLGAKAYLEIYGLNKEWKIYGNPLFWNGYTHPDILGQTIDLRIEQKNKIKALIEIKSFHPNYYGKVYLRNKFVKNHIIQRFRKYTKCQAKKFVLIHLDSKVELIIPSKAQQQLNQNNIKIKIIRNPTDLYNLLKQLIPTTITTQLRIASENKKYLRGFAEEKNSIFEDYAKKTGVGGSFLCYG